MVGSTAASAAPCILLVDDDEADVRAVRRAFQKGGVSCNLTVAKDGEEALDRLRGRSGDSVKRPLLILLDLKMPKMDGFGFLDALRADPTLADHVVFVLSTSNASSDRHRSYAKQAAAYLTKRDFGTNPDAVTQLLKRYLEVVHLP